MWDICLIYDPSDVQKVEHEAPFFVFLGRAQPNFFMLRQEASIPSVVVGWSVGLQQNVEAFATPRRGYCMVPKFCMGS